MNQEWDAFKKNVLREKAHLEALNEQLSSLLKKCTHDELEASTFKYQDAFGEWKILYYDRCPVCGKWLNRRNKQ